MATSEFLVRSSDSAPTGIPTHPGYSTSVIDLLFTAKLIRLSLSDETEKDVQAKTVHLLEEYLLIKRSFVPVYSPVPASSVCVTDRERCAVLLPLNFNHFIVTKVVPYFKDQRATGYQFAVVLLLSEYNMNNINQTTFTPSNLWGKPILDKSSLFMPNDLSVYGNYIVAIPVGNNRHSEEVLFGQNSCIKSPFSHLWRAYVKRNHARPKCILIYSWNLPCSCCTDVIIRSLGEEPYNSTSVIVAHTIFWRSEDDFVHKRNKEKLMSKNIVVEQVKYPTVLPPA